MTSINANEREVSNEIELAAAVADMSIDYIIFTDDIVLEHAINIPTSRASLTFDGLHNETIHSFTDIDSDLIVNTLGIHGKSDIQLTFKNLIMIGRNYYGFPYVWGDDLWLDNSGVSVTYESVTYTGPQIIYHPTGLVRFVNCNITTNREEVGEINRVEVGGDCTFTHTNSADAMFWFRGAVGNAYFRVLEDASVTMTTESYFMYNRVPMTLPATPNPVTYEIRPRAKLTLNSHHGISASDLHFVESFTINENATFRYTQTDVNSTHSSSMYVNGAFTVLNGATVYMQADYANSGALIHFTQNQTTFTVNNPASFVLYSYYSAPVKLSSSAVRNFYFGGGQLNYWTAARPLPTAGNITDESQRKWDIDGWTYFYVSGQVSANTTTVSGTSLTEEEQQRLPDIHDLVFSDMRVVSVGSLQLATDRVIDNGRPITGRTVPGANLLVSYTVDEQDYSTPTLADGGGNFAVGTDINLPVGTVVHVKANTPFLITEMDVTVEEAGEIIIEEAPETIEFTLPPVYANPVMLSRLAPTTPVKVNDTRVYRSQWHLYASTSGPLATADGVTLPDAMVFVLDPQNPVDLGSTPVPIYDSVEEPEFGVTNVYWQAQQGVLVRVTAPIRSGEQYTTRITWTLTADDVD